MAISYYQAQQNGSKRPGEIHLRRELSTKHYAQGLRDYTQKVLIQYLN